MEECHHIYFDLITDEANSEKMKINLPILHVEGQLMSDEIPKILALEIIEECNKELIVVEEEVKSKYTILDKFILDVCCSV